MCLFQNTIYLNRGGFLWFRGDCSVVYVVVCGGGVHGGGGGVRQCKDDYVLIAVMECVTR